jgi:hypothetical protein
MSDIRTVTMTLTNEEWDLVLEAVERYCDCGTPEEGWMSLEWERISTQFVQAVKKARGA